METVASIPAGRVMTYGDVAHEARTEARAVGRVRKPSFTLVRKMLPTMRMPFSSTRVRPCTSISRRYRGRHRGSRAERP
ncbi:hypothetical protein GM708_01015 [Vibrio cholerae]|nr:hypothetical protein [Vibrio cholerae]